MTPDTCVAILQALGVRMTVVGGAEHVLRVDAHGGTITAIYQPDAPPDGRLSFAFRVGAVGRLRVVRRVDYPDQPFKLDTGDLDFDARCAVVADPPAALARLRRPARELAASWVLAGGWISSEGLGLGPAAVARLSPADAIAAAESMVRLGALLYAVPPHTVIQEAVDDPAPGIQAALSGFVKLAVEHGALDVLALVDLAKSGGLPHLWEHLATDEFVADVDTQQDLVTAVARLAPLDALGADEWLRDARGRYGRAAVEAADRALVARTLARLAQGDDRGVADLFRAATGSAALLELLVSETVRQEVSAAAPWFRLLRTEEPEILARLVDVIGAIGGAPDLPWLGSLLGHRSPQVSMTAERAFLDLVPDGLAAGGAAADAIGAALQRGGATGTSVLDLIARLGPACPPGTARLVASRWRGGATAGYVRALAATGDPGATEGLLGLLESAHAVAAIEALGRVGTVNALEPLRALTGFFTDGQIREAAKVAVDAIESRHASRGGLSISMDAAGGGLSPAGDE